MPAQAKDTFQLKGEVYASSFKIEMKNAAGRTLKTVRAGTYRIKIEDHATMHNFPQAPRSAIRFTARPPG